MIERRKMLVAVDGNSGESIVFWCRWRLPDTDLKLAADVETALRMLDDERYDVLYAHKNLPESPSYRGEHHCGFRVTRKGREKNPLGIIGIISGEGIHRGLEELMHQNGANFCIGANVEDEAANFTRGPLTIAEFNELFAPFGFVNE